MHLPLHEREEYVVVLGSVLLARLLMVQAPPRWLTTGSILVEAAGLVDGQALPQVFFSSQAAGYHYYPLIAATSRPLVHLAARC